jgi:hypothetical protein
MRKTANPFPIIACASNLISSVLASETHLLVNKEFTDQRIASESNSNTDDDS